MGVLNEVRWHIGGDSIESFYSAAYEAIRGVTYVSRRDITLYLINPPLLAVLALAMARTLRFITLSRYVSHLQMSECLSLSIVSTAQSVDRVRSQVLAHPSLHVNPLETDSSAALIVSSLINILISPSKVIHPQRESTSNACFDFDLLTTM